jgi:hypothetical protein
MRRAPRGGQRSYGTTKTRDRDASGVGVVEGPSSRGHHPVSFLADRRPSVRSSLLSSAVRLTPPRLADSAAVSRADRAPPRTRRTAAARSTLQPHSSAHGVAPAARRLSRSHLRRILNSWIHHCNGGRPTHGIGSRYSCPTSGQHPGTVFAASPRKRYAVHNELILGALHHECSLGVMSA